MQGCFVVFLLFLGPPGWIMIGVMLMTPPKRELDPLNSFANTFYGKN